MVLKCAESSIFFFCINFFRRVSLVVLVVALLLSVPGKVFASSAPGQWSQSLALPYLLASHVAFSYDGKIYVLGGSAFGGQSKFEILQSIKSDSGEISPWVINSLFPTALIWHSSMQNGDKSYILGGKEENPGSAMGYVDKTFISTITGSGFSSWSSLTPLPQSLAFGGVFIYNNRLYFAGGLGNNVSDVIYSAPINPDGTIGSWSDSGTLPDPMYGMGIFEHSGKLFLLGGTVNGIGKSTIYTADISAIDGSISGWQQLPDGPAYIAGQQLVLVDDTFIFVNGNQVYHTKINQSNTLDPWQTSQNTIPQSIAAGKLVHLNGYLYLIGGHNGSDYVDTVYYAKLDEESGVSLSVPLLKQTNSLWSDEIYDSANKWASNNPGIGRWGCAMTSAAMVFNYHNITKLPDGQDLNPKNLNSWLKNEPDGYVGNGLINWLALTRLSKKAKSQNSNFSYDALEYKRTNDEDKNLFKESIDSNIPVILGEPGHFIVGKGYDDSSIKINDPFYNRADLTEYGETFTSMGRFIPSNTDLSYIMVVSKPDLNFGILDGNGQLVANTFVEDPIQDPSGENAAGPDPVAVSYVEKPASGNYSIEITSNETKEYSLDIYLYESDGDVFLKKLSGIVGEDDLDIYTIKFNKDNNTNQSIKKDVTFDSLIKDIEFYYQTGHIKPLLTKKLLIHEVMLVERLSLRNKKNTPQHLTVLSNIVKALTPKKIDSVASNTLLKSISDLKKSF